MFKDNIDSEASAADQQDMKDMQDEAKRMGLDPKDLVGEESSADFATRHKDPLNLDKPTGLNEPDDEKPAPKATEKKESAIKPDEDEEEEESEEDDSDKGDEGKDDTSKEGQEDGKPSADSNKYVSQRDFRRFGKGIKSGFKELSAAITKLAEAKSPGEKKEAQEDVADEVDDFMTYAQKYKDEKGNPMNAEALRELGALIEKSVMGKIPLDKLKDLTDLSPAMSKMSEDMSRGEIVAEFNTEWKESGIKLLKQQYPNATAEQISKAEEKAFELATSEKYGFVEGKHDAYPLDWIFQKEAEAFKPLLFSPRKKTAEGSAIGDDMDIDGESNPDNILSTSFENMTPQVAAKMEKALGDSDGDDFY